MCQLFGGIKDKAILTSDMRKCEGGTFCARVVCCCHPVPSDAYFEVIECETKSNYWKILSVSVEGLQEDDYDAKPYPF